MKKSHPSNKPVSFHIDELFFSTTDSRGIIEFGNEVFINISGYEKEELFGAPHNVIRHPDMPKCVFKIFWDKLKSGSPVCAYVKNMAKNGDYYWVFASAFPVETKYLSIRFKPSSDLLKVVEDLYADVLQKEKQSSLAEAETYLFDKFKSLGFETYDDFMTHAVIQELNAFELNVSQSGQIILTDPMLKKIAEIKDVTSTKLSSSFSLIGKFNKIGQHFIDSLKDLSTEFRKLSMLSLNMNILAAKFGQEAVSLSIIATEFSTIALEIEKDLKTFSEFSHLLVQKVTLSTFNISALKVQMNMVDFFLKESLRKSATSEHAFDEMIVNEAIFTKSASTSSQALLKTLKELKNEVRGIETQTASVLELVSGLEIIKQVASIESARNDKVQMAFRTYIDEMNAFNLYLRSMMKELNAELQTLSQSSSTVIESTDAIKDNIKILFDLTLKAKVK